MIGIDVQRLSDFPHQFSGGMRQRVAIAMALALEPRLIVADEPVTALDVIVQRQILDVLRSLRDRLGISVVLVTHDISVVAYSATAWPSCTRDRWWRKGRSTKSCASQPSLHDGAVQRLPGSARADGRVDPDRRQPPDLRQPPAGCRFGPRCPFTLARCGVDVALEHVSQDRSVACVRRTKPPRYASKHGRPRHGDLIEVRKLTEHFGVGRGLFAGLTADAPVVRAVDGIDFTLGRGESMGLLGDPAAARPRPAGCCSS